MKVRTDVADMLRAGATTTAIMATLHVGHATVVRARDVLGVPGNPRGGRPLLPVPDLFHARTEPVEGGHLRWTGHFQKGVPVLGRQGRVLTAYRIAFELGHGRAPVGHVRPGCGTPCCVAPDHVQDRPMRQQLDAQYAAIFGSPG